MLQLTREKFTQLISRTAEINGIPGQPGSDSLSFAVAETVEQTLHKKLAETSSFLQAINIVGTRDIAGKKVGLGVGSTIASTTDTTAKERETQDPSALDEDGYTNTKTDFDTHITYDLMDHWSKFPNFQTLYQANIVEAQARDILMVGFNGTARAATSDRKTNSLLQDVNIGWLQKMRVNASGARHLAQYQLGKGDNVANVDALVLSMISDFLDPWHRTSTGLVVLAGRSLVADKYTGLVSAHEKPTDVVALNTLLTNRSIGNVPTMQVPYFPDNALAVGLLPTLSRYYQTGSRRRTIKDNPKRDRIEDYQSVNDSYNVEDYGAWALVENISQFGG